MNQVFFGDCRDALRQMAAQGIKTQSCVTSPPYFGLRSYMPDGVRLKPGLPDDALLHISSFLQGIGVCPHSVIRKSDLPADLRPYFVPAEIGREEALAEYVEAMVSVLALVREVLADDGVLWLNLGDSYSSGSRQTRDSRQEMQEFAGQEGLAPSRVRADNAFRPKNLMGVPWRVALALQDDGWNLRQDIIWHKPNAMPESVTDRCTKAHEYLFLLSKSERYYWDSEAMQEDATGALPGNVNHKHTSEYESGNEKMRTKAGLLDYALRQRSKRDSFKRESSKRATLIPGQSKATHRPDRPEGEGDLTRRNRRSVWSVPTQSYSGAHFAVFPPALIEPCILASTRPGDVVLDPFMGSGTTAQVAQQLGRRWIGCELNPEYAALQQERTAQMAFEI